MKSNRAPVKLPRGGVKQCVRRGRFKVERYNERSDFDDKFMEGGCGGKLFRLCSREGNSVHCLALKCDRLAPIPGTYCLQELDMRGDDWRGAQNVS